MRLALDRTRLMLLPRLLPFLVIIAMSGMLMIDNASRNVWTLQYEKHVLNSNGLFKYPLPFPNSHEHAKIWLAREAILSGDIQKASNYLVSAVVLNDPFLKSVQALLLEKQGKYDEALQVLIEAQDYNSLIALSNSALRTGFPDNALEALHAAMIVDPVQCVLPIVEFLTSGKRDLVAAERILNNALATYPESSYYFSWHLSLGDNLRRQQRYDEAEWVFQTALEENPDYYLTYIGLGWVYYERDNELEKATIEFQKAIAANKLAGDGYYSIAQVLSREHRYYEAEHWYRLAIERNAGNRSWIIGRANNARSAENFDLATSLYLEVIGEYPDYPTPYYEIAWVYRLTMNPEEAKRNIEKALLLKNPPDASYYIRAGQIYDWDGEQLLALKAYQEALRIDPVNNLAKQEIIRLNGQ